MFPAYQKQGYSVRAFPDVCYTPAQPSPLPVPYPSVGGSQSLVKDIKGRDLTGKVLMKSVVVTTSTGNQPGSAPGVISVNKTVFTMMSMDVKVEGANVVRFVDLMLKNPSRAGQLKSRLQNITTQLVGMTKGDNPDQWHQLVDEYLVVSAELYLQLSAT